MVADLKSRSRPLTVCLPADLIAELQIVAQEKNCSIDEVVCEACLEHTENFLWQRCYDLRLPKQFEGDSQYG
jgi:hypothetical protein